MELGETPEEAALRELKEETNLIGHIRMLLGVTSNHSDKYNTVLMVGYLVESYIGTPKAGDDASGFNRITVSKAFFPSSSRPSWV